MEETIVCEEIMEEIIVCAPTLASESSCKRRKKSTSITGSVSTYRNQRNGRCVPRPRRENVKKDDKYSHQKMRMEHAQARKPSTLRRSSRLSQNTEDRECLPERAPGIVPGDISGSIQDDSIDDQAGAVDDEIISIIKSHHYPSDEHEATVGVLALVPQQRDDTPQMKISPRLEGAEEDRLKCNQGPISPAYHNEHTPRAANSNTRNIPVQSHDRLDTTPVSDKTVAILDDIPEHKISNTSLSLTEKQPRVSKSKDEVTKKGPLSSSTTTKATSLPGIKTFQPDAFMTQKRKHDIQGRPSGVGLRDLHERSLQPWFTYRTARWKEMGAQLLSATEDVAQ